MAKHRKAFEAYVLNFMGRITKGGGNRIIYERLFKQLNDEQMDQFVNALRNGGSLCIWASNFNKDEFLDFNNLLKLCQEYGLDLEQHLVIVDKDTGIRTITPIKYIVGVAEIRKQRQMWVKKFSAAKDDTMTDDLTGQVMGDSRATGMSIPEVMVLRYLNLPTVANEIYNVKGGDNKALKAFKNDIMTSGSADTNNALRNGDIVKVLRTAYRIFRGRHIDSNLGTK